MRQSFLLSFAFLLTLTLGTTSAQGTGDSGISASTATGSGSQTSTRSGSSMDLWRIARSARAATLRKQIAASAKREAIWGEQHAAFLQKRIEYRIACRADLRQANRDTKLPTLLRCYRGELSMEREELRREREKIAGLAGVSAEVRTEALQRINSLHEAIGTLLSAIDSDVFQDTPPVTSAREKLQRAYRSHVFTARAFLRADRALSWTALLLSDLPASGSGVTLTGSGMTVTGKRICLQRQETVLRAIVKGETGSTVLPMTLQALQSCIMPLPQTETGGTIPTP